MGISCRIVCDSPDSHLGVIRLINDLLKTNCLLYSCDRIAAKKCKILVHIDLVLEVDGGRLQPTCTYVSLAYPIYSCSYPLLSIAKLWLVALIS